MNNVEKLVEAMNIVIDNMDDAMKEPTVLTEEQENEVVSDGIDKYFEDVEATFEQWSPEMKSYFVERIDRMLEDSEPELFQEKNIVRLDRNAVFNQLVGLFSLVIARRRKDPAFAMYKKGSAIRRKAKTAIKNKYASRAVPIARKFLKKRKVRS